MADHHHDPVLPRLALEEEIERLLIEESKLPERAAARLAKYAVAYYSWLIIAVPDVKERITVLSTITAVFGELFKMELKGVEREENKGPVNVWTYRKEGGNS